jgi:protein-tyrosine phosphatase
MQPLAGARDQPGRAAVQEARPGQVEDQALGLVPADQRQQPGEGGQRHQVELAPDEDRGGFRAHVQLDRDLAGPQVVILRQRTEPRHEDSPLPSERATAGCCQGASSCRQSGTGGASIDLAAGRRGLGGITIASSMPHLGVVRGVCEGVVMAWIELDGAVNVRDLGDLPTSDGQKTARASLLRADNLQELSPADVTKLVRDIGVSTVVDLRSTNELEAEGPAPLDAVAGVRHAHHPVLPEVGANTDVIADALLARDRLDRSRYPDNPVCGHYLGYLEDRPDQVVGALRSIAHSDGAALVHCAAGKDRTGVVVALALTVAGVPASAVAADYAASAERAEALTSRLRRSRLYAPDVNSKRADLQWPRAETMTAFLEQMDARYGGVTSWLSAHGLSDEDLDALRVKLRAGA